MKKALVILGSTGSIGKQTLEVVSIFPSSFSVVALAAKDDVELLFQQVKKFSPKFVTVADEITKQKLAQKLGSAKTQILIGEEGLRQVATLPEVKMVVVAIPGTIALNAVLEAVQAKKQIALATKEILVAAGEVFTRLIKENNVRVFPIDSEHSAIAQCLRGEDPANVKKLILTASGGPFLKISADKFPALTAKDALKHPTWQMGPKVTIDSATLMNKGLEVIEAHYLFGLAYEQIEVVIHPQSIVHSMVEFNDGSIKAQLGVPDMRLPIQYALLEERRQANMWNKLSFAKALQLTFEPVDRQKFPCLEYAYQAGKAGGTLPAALNSANEEAVKLFLAGKINFAQIPQLIKQAMEGHQGK